MTFPITVCIRAGEYQCLENEFGDCYVMFRGRKKVVTGDFAGFEAPDIDELHDPVGIDTTAVIDVGVQRRAIVSDEFELGDHIHAHDALGRVTTSPQTMGVNSYTFTYGYSPTDALTSMTLSFGAAGELRTGRGRP